MMSAWPSLSTSATTGTSSAVAVEGRHRGRPAPAVGHGERAKDEFIVRVIEDRHLLLPLRRLHQHDVGLLVAVEVAGGRERARAAEVPERRRGLVRTGDAVVD